MVGVTEEVDEAVFFVIVLFFYVIHFDKVSGNACNICSTYVCVFLEGSLQCSTKFPPQY